MSNNFETIYQDDEIDTVWTRVPFEGGVAYYKNNISITGEYSQNNPLMFEGDCCQWILESRCGTYKLAYDSLKEAQDASENLNRLTNEQLAQKARVTYNAHGHDYLSYKESNYIDRAIARHNTNGMGYHTSNEDIIKKLESFPLLTVIKHHYKNNDMGTEFVKEWKKVTQNEWVTV